MTQSATIHDLCPAEDAVEMPALPSGSRCGPYRVVRRLAVGGVGDVYEAVHTVLGRRAALKVLQVRHADRAELAERLELEARALSEIHHPNMVTVHDAGVLDGSMPELATAHPLIWMAMEYIEGRTLRDALWPDRRLPPREALSHARHIALGVGAAHATGAVHRDLKPENVMLGQDGRVVVLDLGTAKYLRQSDLRATQRIMGTVAYMSPEHLMGEDVDFRSDVYSLGLVLWEMVVGYHPYSLSNTTAHLPETLALARCQIDVVPRPPHEAIPGLPPLLWDVLEPALQKDPGERYADLGVFVKVLEHALERLGEAPAPQREPPAPPGAAPHGPAPHGEANIPTEALDPEALAAEALAAEALAAEAPSPETPTHTVAHPGAPDAAAGAPGLERPDPKRDPRSWRIPRGRLPKGLTPEEVRRGWERAAAMQREATRRPRWYRHWVAAALFGSAVGALAFYLIFHWPRRQAPTNGDLSARSLEPAENPGR